MARKALLGVVSVLLAWQLTGCAPQAPDHSSWRDQAYLSVEDVSSNVSTMTLLLQLVERGRMFGKYQQIVALNSETNAGRTASHLSAEQPEPRDDAMYTRVTGALSDASDLISNARIALVRRDSASYPHLLKQLQAMSKRLDHLGEAVRR